MTKENQNLIDFARFKYSAKEGESYFLTIFQEDGFHTINLSQFKKSMITFGKDPKNDITISATFLDYQQGYFTLTEHGVLVVNTSSTVPMLGNNKPLNDLYLSEGSFVRIANSNSKTEQSILLLMSIGKTLDEWKQYPLPNGKTTIGSGTSCHLLLSDAGISKIHTTIYCSKNNVIIQEEGSINGTYVNGQILSDSQSLKNLDIIFIANSKIVLCNGQLCYQIYQRGVQLDAINIVKKVHTKLGTKEICSHVNLRIYPSEFVALVGVSGAGKTTFMKCISGVDTPTFGKVLLNGENLYENYEKLKYHIGYVPQDDIVYSNLRLHDMLHYAIRLRLPDITNKEEQEKRIEEVLKIVELTNHKNTYIRQLSGGQRKRASIAVELLADPSLFFLDEPTSGLDPQTERSIMKTLQKMAKMGKTIILVTHNTLNLHLCDKIAFFGEGGLLCFSGSPQETFAFFGVSDFVDIYALLNENSKKWHDKFCEHQLPISLEEIQQETKNKSKIGNKKKSFFQQLFLLIKRYIKLISNDSRQLLLLFAQAPIIAFLLASVTTSDLYSSYDDTKGILFSIGCACIWLGLLNSIQEICKEKVIVKKEYMADLRISSYLCSKFMVQAMLAFIQSTILVVIFQKIAGQSSYHILIDSYWDIQIICFLSILSAASLGLFISSFVKNANMAMSIVPLILVPQLLFSGMLFKLDGIVAFLSYFILCRWSVEGLGTSVNLNELTHAIQKIVPHAVIEAEDYFTFTSSHMLQVISIILIMTIILMLASYIVLKKNIKKDI